LLHFLELAFGMAHTQTTGSILLWIC
jgi:hypothetical protein